MNYKSANLPKHLCVCDLVYVPQPSELWASSIATSYGFRVQGLDSTIEMAQVNIVPYSYSVW